MRKKVIPFPPRKAADSRPVTEGHSRITIRVGAQRYTLNIPCQGVALPREPVLAATKGRLEELQVQTRFLRLCQPAARFLRNCRHESFRRFAIGMVAGL